MQVSNVCGDYEADETRQNRQNRASKGLPYVGIDAVGGGRQTL